MVAAAVLLLVFTFVWSYFFWTRRKYYALALKMPGPMGLPFIGMAHKFYNMTDILYDLPSYASKYKSKTLFSWFGLDPVVYTMEPKVVEIILNSPDCLNKSKFYELVTDVMGDGLTTSKCPRWNYHRKNLNHCFYRTILQEFLPNFNQLGDELCEKFDKLVNCGEVDVKDTVFKMTLKTVLATTMGTDFMPESYTGFLYHYERLVEMTTQRIFKPWLSNSTLFKFMGMYKPFMESRNFILNFVRGFVISKLDIIEQQGLKEITNKKISSVDIQKTKHIFIDQTIKIYQKKEFTLEDVLQEANTIIIAGFETVAVTLISVLICLAMHPKYQELVFEEIITVFPEQEFYANNEDLEKLVYLDMCISETLRVLPTAPLIFRETMNDVVLSKDIVIPKGTQIAVDIFNIQRDEDIWGPDASTFDPDHFLPSNLSNKHRYAFLPFSKGPRNCVGWQYADMIMKVVLAKVLRKYRFSTKCCFKDLRCVFNGTIAFQTLPHLEIVSR